MTGTNINSVNYRFSGHDSFVCRYSWLPKATEIVLSTPNIFQNEEQAIIEMGVGKNMVKSIKFWIDATGIVQYNSPKDGYSLTAFGNSVFVDNYDPYLEDVRTLWLIHWKLSSHVNAPIFAWDYMFNKWHHPDISQSRVLNIFREEASRMGRKISDNTLKSHYNIFLHTYVPTRGAKGEILEDNLDCPLIELDLLHKTGERKIENSNKYEDIYAFNKDDKPEITPELFLYALLDYREKRLPNSLKLSFNQIANGYGSPGQIFKLPEDCIREKLEMLSTITNGFIEYREASDSPHVFIENKEVQASDFIKHIYKYE
jgi:hypothetical protein